MEGVGARLGRSSTRYGPATVFNGPVRKWKKKWVHVASPSSSSNHHHHHHHSHLHNSSSNGTNASHLLLYKWTPLTQSQNSAINSSSSSASASAAPPADSSAAAPEEPPRRKFKYVPIAVLEEQKDDAVEEDAAEKATDEAKPIDTDQSTKDENLDEKPDINDVPMEENQSQDTNKVVRQDLNESTLDLSLGLNAHDGNNDTDSKADHRDS